MLIHRAYSIHVWLSPWFHSMMNQWMIEDEAYPSDRNVFKCSIDSFGQRTFSRRFLCVSMVMKTRIPKRNSSNLWNILLNFNMIYLFESISDVNSEKDVASFHQLIMKWSDWFIPYPSFLSLMNDSSQQKKMKDTMQEYLISRFHLISIDGYLHLF